MRTTKKDFQIFKDSFLYWQKELGLMDYEIFFEHIYLKPVDFEVYARIYVTTMGRAVTVQLNLKIDKDSKKHWTGPAASGKHEAIHLLLNRLRWLGESRYLESSDLQEEEESLVRRLEKVL